MLLWAVSGVTAQASGVSMVGNGSPPFHKPQCFAACTHGSRMVIGCHIQSIRHSDDLCMHNKNGLVSRHRHEAMLQAVSYSHTPTTSPAGIRLTACSRRAILPTDCQPQAEQHCSSMYP